MGDLSTASPTRATSGLADFVDTTFRNLAENRRTLQDRWQQSLDAYKKQSTGKWKTEEGEGWRSNTFVGVTKQKVIAGYALVSDLILSGGKIPFSLIQSPYQRGTYDYNTLSEAQKSVEAQKDLIEQQLSQCNADRQLLNHVLSAALFGTTYAKMGVATIKQSGYTVAQIPEVTDISTLQATELAWQTFSEVKDSPAWFYVPVWEIFRDYETKDIQECSAVFHRRLMSPYWLRQQKGRDYWIDSAIDKVLSEATRMSEQPNNTDESLPPAQRDVKHRVNTLDVREGWLRAPRKTVEEFEAELPAMMKDFNQGTSSVAIEQEDNGDDIEIMAIVINGTIVRFARMDPEYTRPFCEAHWEDTPDDAAGIGVADNMRDSQFVLNGAVRAMEDNKKLSGNTIFGENERYMKNPIGALKPGLRIKVTEECKDIRQALMPVEIPNTADQYISIINMFLQFSDFESMIPKISQGMQTEEKMTAYQVSQQVAMSGKYIGSVVRNFDEGLIEPMVSWFYQYNMDDPMCPAAKGNFIVKAHGFASYQDKVSMIAQLMQFLNIVSNNPLMAQRVKFDSILKKIANVMDMDVNEFVKSEEEIAAEQQMAAQQAQQPPDALTMARVDTEAKKGQAALTSAKASQTSAEAQLAKVELEARKMGIPQLPAVQVAEPNPPVVPPVEANNFNAARQITQ